MELLTFADLTWQAWLSLGVVAAALIYFGALAAAGLRLRQLLRR